MHHASRANFEQRKARDIRCKNIENEQWICLQRMICLQRPSADRFALSITVYTVSPSYRWRTDPSVCSQGNEIVVQLTFV